MNGQRALWPGGTGSARPEGKVGYALAAVWDLAEGRIRTRRSRSDHGASAGPTTCSGMVIS